MSDNAALALILCVATVCATAIVIVALLTGSWGWSK